MRDYAFPCTCAKVEIARTHTHTSVEFEFARLCQASASNYDSCSQCDVNRHAQDMFRKTGVATLPMLLSNCKHLHRVTSWAAYVPAHMCWDRQYVFRTAMHVQEQLVHLAGRQDSSAWTQFYKKTRNVKSFKSSKTVLDAGALC
eukprot:620651-Amphidinium_carterae.1